MLCELSEPATHDSSDDPEGEIESLTGLRSQFISEAGVTDSPRLTLPANPFSDAILIVDLAADKGVATK